MTSLYPMTQEALARCFHSTFVELLPRTGSDQLLVSFASKRGLTSARCVSLSAPPGHPVGDGGNTLIGRVPGTGWLLHQVQLMKSCSSVLRKTTMTMIMMMMMFEMLVVVPVAVHQGSVSLKLRQTGGGRRDLIHECSVFICVFLPKYIFNYNLLALVCVFVRVCAPAPTRGIVMTPSVKAQTRFSSTGECF